MNTALNQHVLVLNRLWQAVNVCTARRALTLLFQGHAQVVLDGNDGSFHTFNFDEWRDFSGRRAARGIRSAPSPSASACRASSCCSFTTGCRKRKSSSPGTTFLSATKTPANTAARLCDRKDLNLDHVIPRDRGGPTTWENIVCSCIECNTHKANRTPQEAGMHLIRKPKRPKWRPFVQINFSLHQHDSWKHFIDLAYWNVELGEDVE